MLISARPVVGKGLGPKGVFDGNAGITLLAEGFIGSSKAFCW